VEKEEEKDEEIVTVDVDTILSQQEEKKKKKKKKKEKKKEEKKSLQRNLELIIQLYIYRNSLNKELGKNIFDFLVLLFLFPVLFYSAHSL
jgi:hypothetical protein